MCSLYLYVLNLCNETLCKLFTTQLILYMNNYDLGVMYEYAL